MSVIKEAEEFISAPICHGNEIRPAITKGAGIIENLLEEISKRDAVIEAAKYFVAHWDAMASDKLHESLKALEES